jgi:hypothetical protein
MPGVTRAREKSQATSSLEGGVMKGIPCTPCSQYRKLGIFEYRCRLVYQIGLQRLAGKNTDFSALTEEWFYRIVQHPLIPNEAG